VARIHLLRLRWRRVGGVVMETDPDICKACGSDDLFDGFFGRDGLAIDDDRATGSRWTTVCNRCGQFQDRRIARGPKQ
jgi:hypothetical protein